MDEERRRILRMMAEGTISVEECDELLRSLSNRRKEKTEKEVQAAQGDRPIWPYVLLVALAIFALPVGFAGLVGLLRGTVWRFGAMRGFSSWLPCVFMVPGLLAPIQILLAIFWVWMIVDCLSRLPCDFRLLFTTQHKYEKWIWLGIVILVFPIGAIVYFFLIRQPAQQIAPPSSEEKPPSPPEKPLRPSPRARSIKPLVIITILFAMLIPLLLVFRHLPMPWHHLGPSLRMYPSQMKMAIIPALVIIPAIVMVLFWVIFWICMLIDCLARDYREFGTLITSDKSADKLVWILLILFLPLIGAIAYHIAIRRRAVSA